MQHTLISQMGEGIHSLPKNVRQAYGVAGSNARPKTAVRATPMPPPNIHKREMDAVHSHRTRILQERIRGGFTPRLESSPPQTASSDYARPRKVSSSTDGTPIRAMSSSESVKRNLAPLFAPSPKLISEHPHGMELHRSLFAIQSKAVPEFLNLMTTLVMRVVLPEMHRGVRVRVGPCRDTIENKARSIVGQVAEPSENPGEAGEIRARFDQLLSDLVSGDDGDVRHNPAYYASVIKAVGDYLESTLCALHGRLSDYVVDVPSLLSLATPESVQDYAEFHGRQKQKIDMVSGVLNIHESTLDDPLQGLLDTIFRYWPGMVDEFGHMTQQQIETRVPLTPEAA